MHRLTRGKSRRGGGARADAKVLVETWRRHDNALRPHNSLHCLIPNEFKQQHQPHPDRTVFEK